MVPEWPRDRFYVDQSLINGDLVELPERIAHQVNRVLRLQPGDQILLFNGDGTDHLATIETSERKRVIVEVADASREGVVIGNPAITLAVALIKSDRFDTVVQKATELGVSAIVPVETDRCVVSLPADRARSRVERWQRIAIEALEQSERADFASIEPPVDYDELIRREDSGIRLIAAERTAQSGLVDVVSRKPSGICLLIGPEGGFSPNELTSAANAGWTSVTLGETILRSETAAIAGIAMIRALTADSKRRH